MDCEEVNCGPIVKKDQMGRESLSFNPRSWVRFAEWSEEESTPIFEFLIRHCTIPEHTIRHNYQDGDVVMWCNNTVVHYGVANYDVGNNDREIWQLMFKLKGDSNDNI
jgi:taurine dioxygenase